MEGHVPYCVADALFQVTLDTRFRRIGDTIVNSTTKLVRGFWSEKRNLHLTLQLLHQIVVTERSQLSIFYGKLG